MKMASRLQRQIYPIPDDVRLAMQNAGVAEAYAARPAYQRNDYIGWITRAKLPATRQRRLDQMLAELRHGGIYMKMKHLPSVSQ